MSERHLLPRSGIQTWGSGCLDAVAVCQCAVASDSRRTEGASELLDLAADVLGLSWKSLYLQTGLEPAVRQIYITADAFGQNIDLNYRTTEVEDPAIEPRELAAQYINPVCTPALQRAISLPVIEAPDLLETVFPEFHVASESQLLCSRLHPVHTQIYILH